MVKDYAKSFYDSSAWRNTRSAYMTSQNYICERCGSVARIVHHKTYITQQNISDPNITLDWTNLEALCMDCHAAEHSSGKICAKGLQFDSNGNLEKSPPLYKK